MNEGFAELLYKSNVNHVHGVCNRHPTVIAVINCVNITGVYKDQM